MIYFLWSLRDCFYCGYVFHHRFSPHGVKECIYEARFLEVSWPASSADGTTRGRMKIPAKDDVVRCITSAPLPGTTIKVLLNGCITNVLRSTCEGDHDADSSLMFPRACDDTNECSRCLGTSSSPLPLNYKAYIASKTRHLAILSTAQEQICVISTRDVVSRNVRTKNRKITLDRHRLTLFLPPRLAAIDDVA